MEIRKSFLVYLIMLTLYGMILTSCGTIPPSVPVSTASRFSELPEGAYAYVYANLQNSRGLIQELYNGSLEDRLKMPASVFNNTDLLYGALYKDTPDYRFYALVPGRYPVFQSHISLTFNPDWKRKRSNGISYWKSEKQGLSLRIEPKEVIITDGKPYRETRSVPVLTGSSGEVKEPEIDFDSLAAPLEKATLFIVLNQRGPLSQFLFNSSIQSPQVPMKQVRLGLYPAADPTSYVIQVWIETESPLYGRALNAILSLASTVKGFIPQKLFAKLLEVKPELDGDTVHLRTNPIPNSELTLLLRDLLVYFDGIK